MEQIDGRQDFLARLAGMHAIAPGIIEARLDKPAGFTFLPGQFVRLLMDGYQRDYTIVSHPEARTIDFCVALVDGGRFSDAITRARAGDRLRLSGPHGHFIFQGPVHPPVFVATGTGVAPFVAFCRTGVRDAILLHGVADPERLVYRHILEPGLRTYVPCISGSFDASGSLKGAFAGRVTAWLEKRLAPGEYDFYLCGRRSMIKDATALIDDRFSGSRLFIENFD